MLGLNEQHGATPTVDQAVGAAKVQTIEPGSHRPQTSLL